MGMKQDIKIALKEETEVSQGDVVEEGVYGIYNWDFSLFNNKIHLQAKLLENNLELTTTAMRSKRPDKEGNTDVEVSRMNTLPIPYGEAKALIEEKQLVEAGDDRIIELLYDVLTPSRKQQGGKSIKQIIREQREHLTSYETVYLDAIQHLLSKHRGYTFNHCGWLAVKTLQEAGPSLVLDPDIVSGLAEWRSATGIFSSMNNRKFVLEEFYPSRASFEAAKDTYTLGEISDIIEKHASVITEDNGTILSIPRATYIVEIIIALYVKTCSCDSSEFPVFEDLQMDPQGSILDRIYEMVVGKNPLRDNRKENNRKKEPPKKDSGDGEKNNHKPADLSSISGDDIKDSIASRSVKKPVSA